MTLKSLQLICRNIEKIQDTYIQYDYKANPVSSNVIFAKENLKTYFKMTQNSHWIINFLHVHCLCANVQSIWSKVESKLKITESQYDTLPKTADNLKDQFTHMVILIVLICAHILLKQV